MNAALLLIPLLFIRYVYLYYISKDAFLKASQLAPMNDLEKRMYLFYVFFNILLFLSLFFLKIQTASLLYIIGFALFIFSIFYLTVTTYYYGLAGVDGFCQDGPYRFSRNPMYLVYFFYFLSAVFLTRSLALLLFLVCFQFFGHWLILSEERWCKDLFGQKYLDYMERVPRYLF